MEMARCADKRACLRVHEGATARGEHDAPAGEQALDHPLFPGAEMCLAMGLEDFGDAHASGALDFVVGIEEGQAKLGGDTLADGGFAGAHKADQHDAALLHGEV